VLFRSHVPVDSPAANWAICKAVRRAQPQTKIAHLAAPQLWAWAPWRIRKLRRLTDHVLCLLPFEPAWFGDRAVKASFVGHPLFEQVRTVNENNSAASRADLPHTALKLALLPGSRAGEIQRNTPTMLAVTHTLQSRHNTLATVIATPNNDATQNVNAAIDALPAATKPKIQIVQGRVDDVLRWADVALVVSGTATLQTAMHHTPMVALYNLPRWKWHMIGRWLVKTRTFTLPNLISESMGQGRVIHEFVPHFGQVEPLAQAIELLLIDDQHRNEQMRNIAEVTACFDGCSFAEEVVEHLAEWLPD